ncbi:MAG: hypothetical protein K5756_05040 [Clostridiales bacterium]|nr:hypothetical protein [Clostridiales bacterium]
MQSNETIKYELVEEIATLSENGNWKKQLNIVQWGDNIAKYDIRSWNKDKTKSGKGITLSIEEMRALKKALNIIDI